MEDAVQEYLEEARRNRLNQNYGKAFAFYLLVLKITPQLRERCYEEFSSTWKEWSDELRKLGRVENLFCLYEQGCDVFVNCDMLHHHMGCHLHQMGMKLEAVGMFRKALVVNPHCQSARVCLENATRGLVDSWHFSMLNDKVRNEKFSSAIQSALHLSPDGCYILDIGSGTGLLSMAAAQHKSCSVYACEMSQTMHSIAEECVASNQLNQIKCLNCHSESLTVSESDVTQTSDNILSQKVDIVISETLDAGGMGEGIVGLIDHAWKHLLKPRSAGGKVLPKSVALYCVVVESEEIRRKHTQLNMDSAFNGVLVTSCVGANFRKNTDRLSVPTAPVEPYTSETMKCVAHKELTDRKFVFEISFNDPDMLDAIASGNYGDISVDLPVIINGKPDAVVLWFDLAVSENCHINTEIGSNYCWEQAIYPIQNDKLDFSGWAQNEELLLTGNETVRLNFTTNTDCLELNSVETLDNDGVIQNCVSQTLSSNSAHIGISEVQMLRLNDIVYTELYCKAILGHENHNKIKILDISNGFSLALFKLLQSTDIDFEFDKYCHSDQEYKAYDCVSALCSGHIHFFTKMPDASAIYSLVVSDVIEPSGLFTPNAIPNIRNSKLCLTSTGRVVPNEITVVAQLINSAELLSKCMVLNDENTLGFKIAETVNDFKVSTHSDLDIQTMNYNSISPPKETLRLNFNSPNFAQNLQANFKKTTVFEITEHHILHAVLFWFKIKLDENLFFETIDPSNHFMQAACVLPQHHNFEIGDEVVLNTTLHNDTLLFSVSKYGA